MQTNNKMLASSSLLSNAAEIKAAGGIEAWYESATGNLLVQRVSRTIAAQLVESEAAVVLATNAIKMIGFF